MYSKKIDSHSFINALSKYIKENDLDITDTPILDTLIENPDMQRLISIWLQTKNEGQLDALLVQTVGRLSRMPEAAQNQALNSLLEQAKFLNSMIPTPSDLDIVLESMGEEKPDTWDGWSDFNLPLSELSQADMKKLQHHVFFINAGIFTANKVVGMSLLETAAFDARVAEIIRGHSDFIMPDRIFSDKLVALLKSDLIIREIVTGVKAVQPIVTPIERQRLGSEEVSVDLLSPSFLVPNERPRFDSEEVSVDLLGSPFPSSIKLQRLETEDFTDSASNSVEDSADLLAEYLGINDDVESTVDLYEGDDSRDIDDSRRELSPISDTTTTDGRDLNISREKPAYSKKLTFWQHFNIIEYDLNELIRIGEINPHDIPDRALTDKEEAIYQLMNRLMYDLEPGLQDMRNQERVTPVRRETISPQSDLSATDTSGDSSSYRFSDTTAVEYPTAEPRRGLKNLDPRKKFEPVIKDTTHNVVYKEYIRDQRKLNPDGKKETRMPRWHREYKERMQQRQNRSSETDVEDTKVSNSNPKPRSKFGK